MMKLVCNVALFAGWHKASRVKISFIIVVFTIKSCPTFSFTLLSFKCSTSAFDGGSRSANDLTTFTLMLDAEDRCQDDPFSLVSSVERKGINVFFTRTMLLCNQLPSFML